MRRFLGTNVPTFIAYVPYIVIVRLFNVPIFKSKLYNNESNVNDCFIYKMIYK